MNKKEKGTRKKRIAETIITEIGKQVVLLFLLLVAVITILVWNQVMTSRTKELTLESKSLSYQLANFFEPYVQIVKQMAVDPEIRTVLRNTKANDNILETPGYDAVFENMTDIQAMDTGNIMAVWISDVDASVLTQSDGFTSEPGWDVSKRPWYKTIETGKPMLTEPYVDASTEMTILSAAMPIYDEDGTPLGVAGLDISLEQTTDMLSKYRIGDTGYIVLLTTHGTIVYHPSEGKLQNNIEDQGFSQEFLDAVAGGKETFVKYKIDGKAEYGYVAFIGETGYVVASALGTWEYFHNMIVIIAVIAVLLVVGIFANFFTMRRTAEKISRPIIQLDETAKKLAAGNLDVEILVESDDEIGELGNSIGKTVDRLKEYIVYIEEISYALGEMANGNLNVELKQDYVGEFVILKEGIINITNSMTSVLSNIRESASQVSTGADDLANAAQGLAEGATTQAAAVEELTATSATVADQVEASGEEAKKSAVETQRVNEMMNNSQEQMLEMADAMDKINETSRRVVSIIQTIEEIADQTNLLALNASIEAARAGEAGKGFAVVASEIGKLADESSKAANTTRELIGISIDQIGKGDVIANNVMESLKQVVLAVENVNTTIKNTAENAAIQSESMEQIRFGVEDISRGIQDNSAMAEECSATSEELAAQAATLNELVQQFQLKE